jgi:DNA-binding response OmpR family regulator
MPPDDLPRFRRLRALICEDSTDIREVMGCLLREAGYDVEETADGSEALDAIRNRPIDIVILDLSLPRTDGFAVLDYLYDHRPGLPVLVMTGLDPDEIERNLTRMRRHDLPTLLLKPVDPDKLLALMELALDKKLPGVPGADPAAPGAAPV